MSCCSTTLAPFRSRDGALQMQQPIKKIAPNSSAIALKIRFYMLSRFIYRLKRLVVTTTFNKRQTVANGHKKSYIDIDKLQEANSL